MCPRYWVIVRGSCKNDCMGVAQQSPECKGLKTCFQESLKIIILIFYFANLKEDLKTIFHF